MPTKTERSRIAEVLSVIHKRYFTEEDSVTLLLKFMTGREQIENCDARQAMNLCQPILIELFPKLDCVNIRNDITKMDSQLDFTNNPTSDNNVIKRWTREIVDNTNYSEKFIIDKLSSCGGLVKDKFIPTRKEAPNYLKFQQDTERLWTC